MVIPELSNKLLYQLLWPQNTVRNEDSVQQANRFIKQYPAFNKIIELDAKIQPIMDDWARHGLRVDANKWNKSLSIYQEEANRYEQKIGTSSSYTLDYVASKASRKFHKTIYNDYKFLKEHRHDPVVNEFRLYKSRRELLEKFEIKGNTTTTKIKKGNWSSYSSYTGRFSCQGPNLMGFPRVTRTSWMPRHINETVYSIDLSNIELRISSILAECSPLVDLFNQGQDVHYKNGKIIADTLADIDSEVLSESVLRKCGKGFVYAILYGGGIKRLSEVVTKAFNKSISQQDAFKAKTALQMVYPELFAFQKKLLKSMNFLQTPFGIEPISYPIKNTARLNLECQFTQSILLKVMIVMVAKYEKINILMPLHDEVIFSTSPDYLDGVYEQLIQEISYAFQRLVPGLPLTNMFKLRKGDKIDE